MAQKTYQITGANGYTLTDGLSADDARRIAQIQADARGETVTVTPYTTDDEDGAIISDLDGEYHVEPTTHHCECGRVMGERCEWTGPIAETVILEWMPESLRASHTAAGNSGYYPHNGAERLRVERSCADRIVTDDDGWSRIVA